MTDGAVPVIEIKRLPEEGAFLLTWEDGFQAKPTYRYLAGYCPCAGCQGHGGGIEYRKPKDGIQPESIKPVGNYALSIVWEGGCRTGIYTFSYLRRLCDGDRRGADGVEAPESVS